MPRTYTAITIGPISDTLSLTSSPAGLWGASYMFSWVARELIQVFVTKGVEPERFITPWFAVDGAGNVTLSDGTEETRVCADMQARGVGMFHDRIIFSGDGRELVPEAVGHVIEELTDRLGAAGSDKEATRTWLRDYLKVYGFVTELAEDAAPLAALSGTLNALELEPAFPTSETHNPLIHLLEGAGTGSDERQTRNEVIKKSGFVRDLGGRWMLLDRDGTVRDIGSIARCGAEKAGRKAEQYYAILNADGDSMSDVLKGLVTPEELRAYSRKCLIYCANASRMILDYAGVPIYAGGDDLLAILPVIGRNPETGESMDLTTLIGELRDLFNDTFKPEVDRIIAWNNSEEGKGEPKKIPTISFGVSVQYEKSPLFEALEAAGNLLYQAKYWYGKAPKNALRLHLRKHSGQSALIALDRLDTDACRGLMTRLDALMLLAAKKAEGGASSGKGEKSADASTFLASAGHQVEQFAALFDSAFADKDGEQTVVHLFDNLFDNAGQQQFKPFLADLRDCAVYLYQINKAQAYSPASPTETLSSLIRLVHFAAEKEDKDNG